MACGSSAIMSPRNCLAIMSPPGIGSYSLGRRSYGQRGADRESERSTADARDPVDVRGASERWERGRAFGSFSSSGKAVEKEEEGELVLWDGSPHRWLGEEGPKWTLVVAMDDATGALLYGVFCDQEDAQSYLVCLKQLLLQKGIPLALYMDRHGIFKRNDDHWTLQEELAGERIPTQVGVALKCLGVEPIFALSPQAKGRVERLFGTLQDRLVSELRLAGICTRDQATAFVNGPFKSDFNRRFSKPPQKTQSAWRKVPRELDVERICSFRYEATVGNDNAVRLAGVILDIPEGPNRRGYAKSRVEVRQLLDGRWRVYLKDELLLETDKADLQIPLRTVRRRHRERLRGVTFSLSS